jgi:hypothetical protein
LFGTALQWRYLFRERASSGVGFEEKRDIETLSRHLDCVGNVKNDGFGWCAKCVDASLGRVPFREYQSCLRKRGEWTLGVVWDFTQDEQFTLWHTRFKVLVRWFYRWHSKIRKHRYRKII